MAPTGDPATDLANLLAGFEANMGVAPKVNPPEAAKVLATKTAAEVAGTPEPAEADQGPAVEPPTSKPADVAAAEAAPKKNRTAAVVQKELDTLLEIHNKLVAEHEAARMELVGYAAKVRDEFSSEVAVLAADLTKAVHRCEELQNTVSHQQGLLSQAASAITMMNARAAQAPATAAGPLENLHPKVLSDALSKQGFTVNLTVPAA